MGTSERAALAFAAIVCVIAPACELLVPLDRAARANADAAIDTGAADAGVDPCGVVPPPPPADTDGPSHAPIVLAAFRWAISAYSDPALFCDNSGFDLDGVTTGPPGACNEQRSCVPIPPAVASRGRLFGCDDPNGADRGVADLYAFASEAPGLRSVFKEEDLNKLVSKGLMNSILELEDYNGRADDPDVKVSLFGSSGLDTVDAAAGRPFTLAELLALPDVWSGTEDAGWKLDESTVDRGGLARARFREVGYVRDHVLVLPALHEGIFPVPVLARGLPYFGGVMMGRIVAPTDGGPYRLTHVRVGTRVASRALLGVVGGSAVDGIGVTGPICAPAGELAYGVIRDVLCSSLDLPPLDAGADATCGELSISAHLAYVESRYSLTPTGAPVVEPSRTTLEPPCLDDAGTEWCDDCAWAQPTRCPARDAGAR